MDSNFARIYLQINLVPPNFYILTFLHFYILHVDSTPTPKDTMASIQHMLTLISQWAVIASGAHSWFGSAITIFGSMCGHEA